MQAYLNIITSKYWTLLTFLNMLRSVPQETMMDELSIEKDREEASTFYANSRYFKKYNNLMIQLKEENKSQQQHYPANPHYNLKWYNNIFLKSILSLRSSFMSPEKKRFSNAMYLMVLQTSRRHPFWIKLKRGISQFWLILSGRFTKIRCNKARET